MNNDKEVMQMALDTFNKSKRSHYYCEDRFYSCPQHEEGCADALEGDECNCGANLVNETIDRAIEALRTALAQPELEPVEYVANERFDASKHPIWVGLTEQERNTIEDYCKMMIGKAAFDAIEAKLKKKNT